MNSPLTHKTILIMKNIDFLQYLRAQEDAAYERIKLGHFDENGAAYYRGKHDQVFTMRRELEERLALAAIMLDDNIDSAVDSLRNARKRTITKSARGAIDGVIAMLESMKEEKL